MNIGNVEITYQTDKRIEGKNHFENFKFEIMDTGEGVIIRVWDNEGGYVSDATKCPMDVALAHVLLHRPGQQLRIEYVEA
jgi:hypothetical protein